jgi:hypothetical protein
MRRALLILAIILVFSATMIEVQAAQVTIYWMWKKQNQIGTQTADSGKTFVVVTATIMNQGYSDFGTSPYFFRLDTGSEAHGVSPVTSQLPNPLPIADLPNGAQITGSLAFHVSQSATSFTLRYVREGRAYDLRYIQQGRCIIATAAYGSELEPEIQLLRDFRDQRLLSTFAGRGFMTVFNTFYYSFSPQIAEIVASNSIIAELTKTMISPLIQILKVFAMVDATELSTVCVGLAVSALTGIAYLTLPFVLVVFFRRHEPE